MKLLPVLILIGAMGLIYFLGFDKYLTLDTLRDNRTALQSYVTTHTILSPLIYIAIYSAVVALSLPGASLMSVAGGLLFGIIFGGFTAVIGATIGASILFIVARMFLSEYIRDRAGGYLKRMEKGFGENAFSYLFFLRVVPAFPFWAVNLAAAVLNVPPVTFIVATLIGIIPGTYVFVAFGAGLGDLIDAGKNVRVGDIFSTNLIIAFIGLGVLSLLPVVIKTLTRQKT